MSLTQELDSVGAHERQAEYGNVHRGVVQRHVLHVTLGDRVVDGHQIERVHLVLDRLGQVGLAAAKVGDYLIR